MVSQVAHFLLPHGWSLGLGVVIFLHAFQTPFGFKPALMGLLWVAAWFYQARVRRSGFWGPLRTPLDGPIGLMLVIILISMINSEDLYNSEAQALEFIASILLYYLLSSRAIVRSYSDIVVILRSWIASLAVLALSGTIAMVLLFITGELPSWATYLTRTGAPRLTLRFYYYNPDSLGTFLVPGFSFCLGILLWGGRWLTRTQSVLLWILIGTLEWTLLSTLSRGAWITMLGVVVCLWILPRLARRRMRKIIIPINVTLGLATVALSWILSVMMFSPPFFDSLLSRSNPVALINEQDQERLTIWRGAWNMFLNNPWGVGWGNFGIAYERYKLPGALPIGSPHNLFLEIATELGILGIVAFAWLLLRAFRLTIEALQRMPKDTWAFPVLIGVSLGLIGDLLQGLTQSMFFLRVFWFNLGLLVAATRAIPADHNADLKQI